MSALRGRKKMQLMRLFRMGILAFMASLVGAVPMFAQGAGLDGYITGPQDSALEGVSVTATSPSLISPAVAVSDSRGYYRFVVLAPGTYTLTASLSGFQTTKREGLQVRAGNTFTVNLGLHIGERQDTVVVSETPLLIDERNPTTSVNVDGELLRRAPFTPRRLWSDALDIVPAVSSRPITGLDQAKRAYYYLGANIFSHSLSINGAPANAYTDGGAHSLDLSSDAVVEVEMKTGGLDAASPNSTGLVTNVVTKRGGETFAGSGAFTYQDIDWNANNASSGTPATQGVKLVDVNAGGPIVHGRAWFFGLLRYSDLSNGISRTATDIASVLKFVPNFTPFNNWSRSYQPFASVTLQATPRQLFQFNYQYDRSRYTLDAARDAQVFSYGSTGGSLAQVTLSSTWTQHLITQLSASWNNKSGAGKDTYKDLAGSGPQVIIHQNTFLSGGVPTGTGALVTKDDAQSLDTRNGVMAVLRGDLTYLRESRFGSHEFKAGFYVAPVLHYDAVAQAVNNGFTLEEDRQINPDNPADGVIAFHRHYVDVPNQQVVKARDRDIGLYLEDAWKPVASLTVNVGVRVELVRRYDALFNVVRQNSVEVGPRVGAAWAPWDGKTVLRASYGRVQEAVNGRDPITLLGSTITSGGGVVSQSARSSSRDIYDTTGSGVFDLTVTTSAGTPLLNNLQFAPGLHQPYVDDFLVGVRRQLPARLGVDVSWTRRYYRDKWDVVDINGIYPNGPNQAFGGFGLVDPTRGIFYQERNATWNSQVYSALQVVVSKPLSNNVEFIVGVNRQWQHVSGTWNPTDPARFIQPNAFANNREIGHIFGNDDYNSLDGRGIPNGAANRPYSVRIAGIYHAPKKLQLAGSYVIQAGDYSGPILTQIAAADPVFGPSTITLANGTKQSNPLATTIRFAYPTRGEGQVRNDTSRYLQLSASRAFNLGHNQQFEPEINLFNAFNNSAQTQFATGANQKYSTNYLTGTNRISPFSLSLTAKYRF